MTIVIERPCMACSVGLFAECHNPVEVFEDGWIIPCVTLFRSSAPQRVQGEERPRRVTIDGTLGRPSLDPDDITDIKSTGRKRAARALPILDGMPCSWMGLKFAGGGPIPIVGCRDHVLVKAISTADGNVYGGHLHHGPDKNVLNNAVGTNLHAVCTQCHNRTHAVNNQFYTEPRPAAGSVWLPSVPYWRHDPLTTATEDDYRISDEWWALPVEARGPYPFTPTDPPLQASSPLVRQSVSGNPFSDSVGGGLLGMDRD